MITCLRIDSELIELELFIYLFISYQALQSMYNEK